MRKGRVGTSTGGIQQTNRSHHQKLMQMIEFIKLENNKEKLNHYFGQVDEILINTERFVLMIENDHIVRSEATSDLVNEFIPKILQLTNTRVHENEVKLFVSSFIEKVFNKNPEISIENTKSCAESLSIMLVSSDNINVKKRIITASIAVVRKSVELIAVRQQEIQSQKIINLLYSHMSLLKKTIIMNCFDFGNEGIQSHTIHFIENLIFMNSSLTRQNLSEEVISNLLTYLQITGNTYQVRSIEPYPIDLTFVTRMNESGAESVILKVEEMRKEGEKLLKMMIDKGKKYNTSATAMSALIQSLLNIAKQRPEFWTPIIPFLADDVPNILDQNDMTPSQKSSLRYLLKSVLLFLLRMPETRHKFRLYITKGLERIGARDSIGAVIRFVERHTSIELKRKQDVAQTSAEERDSKMRKVEQTPRPNQVSQPQVAAQKPEEATSILYIGYVPKPLSNVELADMVLNNLSSVKSSGSGQTKVLANSNQLVNVILSTLSNHYYKRHVTGTHQSNTYTSEQQQQYMSAVQSFLAEPVPAFNTDMLTVTSLQKQAPNPYQQARASPYATGKSPYSAQQAIPQKVDPRLAAQSQAMQPRDPRQALKSDYVLDKSKAYSASQKAGATAPMRIGDEESEDEEEVVTYKPKVEEKQPVVEDTSDMNENLAKEFKLKLSILDDNTKGQLKQFNWNRMLTNEHSMKREGKDHYRIKLICMMAVRSDENDAQYQQLLKFIKEDFKGRFALCMMWLYMEYKNTLYGQYGIKKEEEGTQVENRFTKLYHTILKSIEKSDATLSRFVVQAPIITQVAIDYICKEMCESDNYTPYGLTTLRDLILYRQPISRKCLDLILQYTVHESSKIRTPAIQLVRDGAFFELYGKEVTEFAFANIKTLKERVLAPVIAPTPEESTEMTDEGEEPVPVPNTNDLTIKQYASLYMAVCSTHCDTMFDQLVEMFTEFKSDEKHVQVANVLESEILSIVKSSHINKEIVLQYLKQFNEKYCLELSLKIIQQLAQLGIDEVLSKVLIYNFFDRKIKDPQFVLPIITQLNKEQVKEALPIVVRSINDVNLLKKCITDLMTANPKSEKPDKISYDEILVVLHQVDASSDNKSQAFANARELLNMCLNTECKKLFTPQILKTALSQICELPTLPKMIMRTVIQILNYNEELASYIIRYTFKRLIERKAYENKNITTGLSKCLSDKYSLFQPVKVADLLIDLGERSEKALTDVLQDHNLRDRFMEFLKIQQHPKLDHFTKLVSSLATTNGDK